MRKSKVTWPIVFKKKKKKKKKNLAQKKFGKSLSLSKALIAKATPCSRLRFTEYTPKPGISPVLVPNSLRKNNETRRLRNYHNPILRRYCAHFYLRVKAIYRSEWTPFFDRLINYSCAASDFFFYAFHALKIFCCSMLRLRSCCIVWCQFERVHLE